MGLYKNKTRKWCLEQLGQLVMWSKYGVNGKDGDGVEYIYKLNNTGVGG